MPGAPELACTIAALLEERDPVGREDADLELRLAIVEGAEACPHGARGWRARVRQGADRYRERLARLEPSAPPDAPVTADHLVACGWPDRVARRRRSGGHQLANGRSAQLEGAQRLGREPWLAVAELGGGAGRRGDRIGLAAALDPALFAGPLAHLVRETTITEWERGGDRFVAERQRRIGALVLARRPLDPIPEGLREQALLDALADRGLGLLDFGADARALRDRVALLRRVQPEADWPDLSDAALLAAPDTWLTPWLQGLRRLGDLRRIDVRSCLEARLGWSRRQALDRLAPPRIEVPSGSRVAVDYRADPPVLAVRLQEMFGCTRTPTIADGRVEVVLHLLSPAGRPLQVTRDLGTFWREGYPEVRREMRGRYPKHPWPEDPLGATPTRHTKRRAPDS